MTVESTSDWKAVMVGMRSSLPLACARTSARSSVRVRLQTCVAALTGNELYLNGSYSGSTSSHAAFASPGTGASSDVTVVIAANSDTPMAGENSSSRVGIASDLSSIARSVCISASGAPLE